MSLTAKVAIDLANVDPSRARHYLACLPTLPTGAAVDVLVAASAPNPEACRLIGEHTGRLRITLVGTSVVVRWLDQIERPDDLLWPWLGVA